MPHTRTHTGSRLRLLSVIFACLLLAACGTAPGGGGGGGDGGGPPSEEQAVWLQLVNLARSADRQCGGSVYPAVPAVAWDERVARAAQLHSEYMAARNEMTHEGPAGLETPDKRIAAQGYAWTYVSENIAVGQADADTALTDWLESTDGHCEAIMDPRAEDMGMGYSESDSGRSYWTQNFARER